MRFAFIAPGRADIPSPNMVSIEILIWNYAQYLRRLGHEVDIYNSNWPHEVIEALNRQTYDFVHLEFDVFAINFNKYLKGRYCLTSHSSWFERITPTDFSHYPAFGNLVADMLEAPGMVVLSERIHQFYQGLGYSGFLRTLRNPVEVEKFRFAEQGNGRAVCLGAIQPRKRQAAMARLFEGTVPVDFVGGIYDPDFAENSTSRHAGLWDRDTLYGRLTEYSCLILNTESEADPLSVKEALAAGLSVVISRCASANLDSHPFITVLPDEVTDGPQWLEAVQAAVEANGRHRQAARQYMRERFDYQVVVPEYVKIAQEFAQS